MSAIHFDITGDNKHLVSVINDTTKRMEEMSKTVKDLGRHFDMSSAEAQLKSLNTVIEDQEAVIEELGKQLDELAEKQQQAAEAGDTKAVADYGRQMTQLAGEIKTAKDELDQFKSAQQILSNQTKESTEITKKAYGDNVGALEKLVGGSKNYTNILRFLPAPLQKVARGINSITNAAKAFLMTPIGAALAAIAVALKGVSYWLNNTFKGQKFVKQASDAFEQLSINITGTSKKIKQLQEATRQGAASQVSALFKLKAQWDATNGSIEKQQKILASSEWEKAGIAVNSLNQAEKVLNEDTDAVVNAILARAEAMALYKQAEKDVDKYLEEKQRLENENAKHAQKAANAQNIANILLSAPGGAGAWAAPLFQKRAENQKGKIVEDVDGALQVYRDAFKESYQKAAAKEGDAESLFKALHIEPTDKDYEALKAGLQKYNDYVRRFAEEQRRLKIDLRNQTEQAEIDAMAEGNEKQRRQMELNHEMQLEEIGRWYKDLREAKIKNAQEQFESNPANAGKAFTYDANSTAFDATPEEMALYNAKIVAEYATYRRNQQAFYRESNASRLEYLQQYGEYEEKRLAIIEKYNSEIEATNDEWQKKIYGKQMEDALNDLEEQYSNFYRKLAQDRSEWLVGDTADLLAEAERKLAQFGDETTITDIDQLERIQRLKQEVKELKNELTKSFSVKGILKNLLDLEGKSGGKSFRERLISLRDAWSQMTTDQRWGVVGDYVSSISNGLGKAADNMREIASISGDSALAEAADALSTAADSFATIGQGAASGGAIGAIVGAITTVINQTVQAITNAALQEKIAERNAQDWADAIERLAIAVNEADFQTIFGQKNIALGQARFKEAIGYIDLYRTKLAKLNEEYDNNLDVWDNSKFSTQISAIKKGYQGLQRMLVKTKDNTAFAQFFGFNDKYTALGDLAPQLWDEEGIFNTDAARAFLEVNTQLTDEQRKQIENLIELKEGYDDALASIDSLISDTFGNLSSSITDIIWDSVMNGTDAWENFEQVGSQAIASLGKQLINEMLISEYLEQFRDQMRQAYQADNTADTQSQLRDIIGNIFGGMNQMFAAGSAVAEEYKEWAQANGFNLSSSASDQRKAQTRSALGASQDSIDESNARLTTIQGHTYELNENVRKLVAASGLSGFATPDLAMGRTDYTEAIALIGQQVAFQSQQIAALGAIVSGIQTDTAGIAEGTNTMILQSADSIKTSNKIQRGLEQVVDSGLRIK